MESIFELAGNLLLILTKLDLEHGLAQPQLVDASSHTPNGGPSLNDLLAKGNADLVDLLQMVLNWKIGESAVCGDISQFYNTLVLKEEHWKYQQVIWYDEMDPSKPLKRGIIRTAIYGVRCSGAQTEEVMRTVAEDVKDPLPQVYKLLVDLRYVDDFGKGNKNTEESKQLIKDTEDTLDKVQMRVKGWAISGEPPPSDLSDDGNSIGFAGMSWYPEIDVFSLNIDSLHFGKKKRGRYPPDLKRFSGTFGTTLEDFVPKELTRRMCTSVTYRLYDPTQMLAPLHLRLKHDLRKILKIDPGWDVPISAELRLRWIENFRMIEDLREILYVRCHIPEDALRPTVRVWLLCDTAEGGMMITCHTGYERPNREWSCGLLFAKNLLAPEDWTIAKLELHSLSTLASIAAILKKALDGWIEIMLYAGDSEIAISWTMYPKCKLQVFHRLRVSNIINKLELKNLYHVDGKFNLADLGTRPDLLTVEQISPGSEWLTGKDWMKLPVEDAVKQGILKSAHDIVLDNDKKRTFKEAIIYDDLSSNYVVNAVDCKKTVELITFSDYVYPILRRSFRSAVRVTGFILLFCAKMKRKMILARIKRGKAEKSRLDECNFPPVQFKAFPLIYDSNYSTTETVPKNPLLNENLSQFFSIEGVTRKNSYEWNGSDWNAKPNSKVLVKLSDEVLSAALQYLYKKATLELYKLYNKKDINKFGVLIGGILYSKSRIHESQMLRAVGGLENVIDLESLTGINFQVPVIDRHSPLALSIANHLHYCLFKHRGPETIYRMSLQYAQILKGRSLFNDIGNDCIFCKKIRVKYIEQLMGPVSNFQLSISPIFYYTYVDAFGPVKGFIPGFQKATRGGSKTYDLQIIVFACAATGTVNCQAMTGGKDTWCVLEVFNRFFWENSVPKIMLPDKDGAFLKVLSEAEIDVVDLEGVLSRERGILFRTCSAQDHSAHGRIEAKIKMIQDSLTRTHIKKERLHSLGWQTLAKFVEHEVNSVPLGYLHHQTHNGPLLRILSPNALKMNTASNRAPTSLFEIPNKTGNLFTKIGETYKLWYRVWNTEYVPLLASRPKWHKESENLVEGDIVYFKLKNSKLKQVWMIGKVEFVNISKDTLVRTIGISYRYNTEDGKAEYDVVERPVRECTKLFHIEDTSILEDIQAAQAEAKKILDEENAHTSNE